jgi:hypothetical protein
MICFCARPRGPRFATRASLGAIPKDTAVLEIGEGLATARALSGLAHDLFEATVSYIEENVHQRVTNATRYMKTGNRAGGRAVWAPDLQVV